MTRRPITDAIINGITARRLRRLIRSLMYSGQDNRIHRIEAIITKPATTNFH